MKKKPSDNSASSNPESPADSQSRESEKKFPGYPSYPQEEDLYVKSTEKADLDPENPKQIKTPNSPADQPNHINNNSDQSGSDLDIPGTELDDNQEAIGSEDEENNHYSLGGDEKENLEENQGD